MSSKKLKSDRLALSAVNDSGSHLAAVIGHLTSHFAAEAEWMTRSGYPHAECHLAEHAAVFASATEVLALDETRRPAVARAFFRSWQHGFQRTRSTWIPRSRTGCASCPSAASLSYFSGWGECPHPLQASIEPDAQTAIDAQREAVVEICLHCSSRIGSEKTDLMVSRR